MQSDNSVVVINNNFVLKSGCFSPISNIDHIVRSNVFTNTQTHTPPGGAIQHHNITPIGTHIIYIA